MVIDREVRDIIKHALSEDLGRQDLTSLFVIPMHFKTRGAIIARESGVLCGIDVVKAVFKERSRSINFKAMKKDGQSFDKDEIVAYVGGEALSILNCERVALNLLAILSGVATKTRQFVDKIAGTGARILDTRKTIPNLRSLQKYAVRMGGGYNHRKTLGEAILIKDNHLRAGKFMNGAHLDKDKIQRSLTYLRNYSHIKLEIEVENLEDFSVVISQKPSVIMLDNFKVVNIKKAVQIRNQKYPAVKLEASGGVNLDNVREIAKTGVDFISIGALTHSARSLDFSLEIVE